MNRDNDFFTVVGKLPKKDKYGNDITGDKLGKGGFHRDDGTYSGVVQDLKIVDEKPKKRKSSTPTKPKNPSPTKDIKQTGVKEFILGTVKETAKDIAVELFKEAIHQGFNSIKNNIKRKIAERKEANKLKQSEECKDYTESSNPQEEKIPETICEIENVEREQIDIACENYIVNMTSEEAQKELLDAFILRILSEKKLWRLSHAKVTDSEGNITDGQKMIEKLSDPKLLSNINVILSNNIDLLENWQMAALKDILKRELVQDGNYIPIESENLRKQLMIYEHCEPS